MSFWSRFPFARITLAFIAGILVNFYCENWLHLAIGLFGGLFLIYVLAVVLVPPAQHHTWSAFTGLLGLASVFWIGYLRLETSRTRLITDHLTYLDTPVAYEAIALEDAVNKDERCNVVVTVRHVCIKGNWQQATGKVVLAFPKAAIPAVHYGHVLLVCGAPSIVPAPKNPYEFDYATFLSTSQIYYQHFLEANELSITGYRPPSSIQAGAFKVLRYCRALLSRHIRHPEALAVVQAIVLGQKDDLTRELRSVYTGTGTMHVLAVSGLHVGILYWLMNLLLYWLGRLPYVRRLSPVFIMGTLWFYAFITGLSPSVLRATLMFTLVLLAPILSRQSNIYNTLASSAFLLLFWNPWWLFSVSFQLSYLAVWGIVYLQPRIYGNTVVRQILLHKLWVWSSISLAAQIATGPISLYYFHQFPTYFVVANWIMVPAALFIFCMGLLVLATGFLPSLSGAVAWVLTKVVEGVNAALVAIQMLPCSIIDNIHLDVTSVLLLYALLFCWLFFFHTRQLRYGIALSMLATMLSVYATRIYLVQRIQRKVIFYSTGRHQVVGFFKGNQGILYTDNRFEKYPNKYFYHVQPSQVALGVTSLAQYTFDTASKQPDLPLRSWHGMQLAAWQGKKFAFVNQRSGPAPLLNAKVHVDFLVVENNAVATLLPLLQRFTFDKLVVGASNSKRITKQLQQEARIYGVSSHSLRQQGALVITW